MHEYLNEASSAGRRSGSVERIAALLLLNFLLKINFALRGVACVCVDLNMKMPFNTAETLRAWLLSALVVHGAVGGNPDAKRLYDDLLSNYNKLVRPVVNTSDVLKVCIKLKLSQLIDVVSILLHFMFFVHLLSLSFY